MKTSSQLSRVWPSLCDFVPFSKGLVSKLQCPVKIQSKPVLEFLIFQRATFQKSERKEIQLMSIMSFKSLNLKYHFDTHSEVTIYNSKIVMRYWIY